MKQKLILLFALLVIFFIGCGEVSHLLNKIKISPSSATVDIGGTQAFTATGRDEAGNIVSFTPTWSVTGGIGSIEGSGLTITFLANATGEGRVYATAEGVSGFASVTVITGELVSIDVTPSPVSLDTWDSQQFTATGRNTEGGAIPVTPTWSVTGGIGTVNATGLFTAEAAGTGSVEAGTFYDSSWIVGTAEVTVTAQSFDVEITPEACTYVSSVAASTKYGATNEVYCGLDNTDGSRYISYLKFDLSSIPSDATITSAKFKFFVLGGVFDGNGGVDIVIKYITSTWNESTLDYNAHLSINAPGTITSTSILSTGWSSDINTGFEGIVSQWVSGSLSNYGFRMEPSSSDLLYFKFDGRMTAINYPRLEVTYTY